MDEKSLLRKNRIAGSRRGRHHGRRARCPQEGHDGAEDEQDDGEHDGLAVHERLQAAALGRAPSITLVFRSAYTATPTTLAAVGLAGTAACTGGCAAC